MVEWCDEGTSVEPMMTFIAFDEDDTKTLLHKLCGD